MLVVPLHDRNNLQWHTPKEGAPVYYLTNFFRKLHENEKKYIVRGRAQGTPRSGSDLLVLQWSRLAVGISGENVPSG